MRTLLFFALASFAPLAPAQLPSVDLNAGIHLIHAEVAADFGSRMQGLMYRESLAPNSGMLFVFGDAAVQCMWMKNTLIPLSVAFLDAQGTIINIADMKPQTEDTHCSTRPAPLALEMALGWFARHGIKPGMKIGGLEKLSR